MHVTHTGPRRRPDDPPKERVIARRLRAAHGWPVETRDVCVGAFSTGACRVTMRADCRIQQNHNKREYCMPSA